MANAGFSRFPAVWASREANGFFIALPRIGPRNWRLRHGLRHDKLAKKYGEGMMRAILFAACLVLAPLMVHAATPDITGTWQGNGRVFKIEKSRHGVYRAEMFILGEEQEGRLNGNSISTLTLQGSKITFALDRSLGSFEGALSGNGKSLTGVWRAAGPDRPLALERANKATAWPIDPSPHASRLVQVDKDVSLEVLDWGGNGPPLLFLAGLGNTAHVFDKFAPKFIATRHVYGVTRRGFGISSTPPPTDRNYDADRLADDVLAVMDTLKLDRPVVAGHSVAGSELSAIGSRHPERVAGLIYLDAANGGAFYEPAVGLMAFDVDRSIVHRDLGRLASAPPAEAQRLITEIQATMPNLEKDFPGFAEARKWVPELPPPPETPQLLVNNIINTNFRKHTAVKAPFLAIIAAPHECKPNCDSAFAKSDAIVIPAQADAIQAHYPAAKIVRLPYANHYVFRSNEADVIREMNAFMAGLPK